MKRKINSLITKYGFTLKEYNFYSNQYNFYIRKDGAIYEVAESFYIGEPQEEILKRIEDYIKTL